MGMLLVVGAIICYVFGSIFTIYSLYHAFKVVFG